MLRPLCDMTHNCSEVSHSKVDSQAFPLARLEGQKLDEDTGKLPGDAGAVGMHRNTILSLAAKG